MNAYTLATPTMSILITMAQLGIPAALSKLTAQSKNTYPPLLASLMIICINTLFLSISFSILAPFLADHVIQQQNILLVFQSILPLLPLVSLSGALKDIYMVYKTYTGRGNTNMGRNCQTVILIYCFCFMSPSQRNTHGKHCHAVYQRWRSCQLLLHDSISAYIF